MSYILDALNKQESAGNTARNLQATSAEQPRQSWLPIIGLALIANAIVVGVWLWQSDAPDSTNAVGTDSANTPADQRPPASVPNGEPIPAEQSQVADDELVTTFDEMHTPSVEPLTSSRPIATPPAQQPRPSSNRDQLTITTQPGEVVISPPGARPIIIEESVAATNPADAASDESGAANPIAENNPTAIEALETASAPAQQADEGAAVIGSFITFDELDGATRERFPEIEVSTHIYAEEADLRAVVFERRRLQEGDTIAGLPLVHITEVGLVVRFEGQLIELSVLDDWEGY